MKRTFAVVIATLLIAVPAYAAPAYASGAKHRPKAPSATLRVMQKWTYQGKGRLTVTASCSQRANLRVVESGMLRHPVVMRKDVKLLIKVTNRTKPGKYIMTLWCVNRRNQVDAMDMRWVKIMKVLPGWKQPRAPRLPKHFKPTVTVRSGGPAVAHPKKKKRR